MQVAMYYKNSDVRIEEIPKPTISKGELLMKVRASGICGSDVMEWYRAKKAPLVLGHEATGEIVEVGQGVNDFKVGDRIFAAHHVPCNTCCYCLSGHHTACEILHTTNFFPGGFSEYIRIPAINVERGVFKLPDEISFEEGTLIEPLACVVRSQRQIKLEASQEILILGAGISGLLHLILAKAKRAKPIIVTDIDQYRLNKAKEFGADFVLSAKEDIPAKLSGLGVRLANQVIICTSAMSAFKQALKSVDRGGTILCFAPTEPGKELSIPINDFWRNAITITHSYGSSPQDTAEAIELMKERKVLVDKLITHKVSLKDTQAGFRLVAQGGDSLKVIVEPNK